VIEPSLISYLAADSAISARIASGSPLVARIFPEILPQNTILPAITFTRIGSQHPEQLAGDPDLSFAQFQVSCWAATAKLAAEVAACVRIRMQGVGGTDFQKVSIDDERSDYEPDTLLYRQDVDFTIAYAESSP
jgi:hypothetical protein